MTISELLPIHSGQGTKQTVSAKQLHFFLGFLKTNWAAWYKSNLIKNKFAIENEDYSPLVVGTNANGSPNMDFEITLDLAKRLSMMARTDKGEVARNYFIECERKVINPELSDADIMNRAFLIATKQNEALTLENSELKAQREADKPKLENHDAMLNTDSVFSLDEAGKSLGISGIKLKKLLKQTKFFTDKGLPYQKYLTDRFFKVIPEILGFDGSVYMKVWITGKGLEMLTGWFKTMNNPNLKKKGLV